MELCSASKSGGVEGWRKTTMMPVRVHEILGLPMSNSKTGKPHRSEPVRVKQLLELMESSSKPKMNFPARRITVAPSGTGKVRRQLYSEAVDETLPDTSIIEGSHASAENSVKKLINITSTEKSRAVRLGLSKSDGKVKLNDQRLQPVRVKLLMESWEKSQTAKRAGKKSVTGNLRSINVRRKLYSVVPSPVASHKVSKKSLAPNKPQEQVNTLQKSQMAFKPNAEKSLKITQQKSRKSCLLPPNSIRDKHISLQTKDTIIEESPTSLFSENNENSSVNKQEIKVATAPDIHKIASLPATELPSNSLQAIDSVVASSSQKSEKLFDSNVEIPRPTVIMGFATSSVSKNRNQSVSSDCSSKSAFVLSHPPLEELNKNSTMPLQRIDAADTSLQDLLGTSETDRQIFEPRSSFLPYNSFLLNCESNKSSLAQIDKKTLLWLRGNMKLSIQTTEESLFSMKQMLKTIDDIINNSEQDKNPAEIDDYVSAELPKILVEDTDFIEEKENDSFANCLVHEDEIFQGKTKEDIDEKLAEDKENLIEENCDPVEEDKEKENGEKTRRRSARLAAIKALSMKNPDDSFSRIEKELNITHEKSMKISPDKMTPAKKKSVDPRNRKSLREYMALKSCAKFLQTPDHKGLPTPKCEKTGTPAERRATERALSRRVLNQLHNLYDESPE